MLSPIEWLMSLLAILLFLTAVSDCKYRRIPNSLCIVTALFCGGLMVANDQWSNMFHPFAVMAIGVLLSHYRILGGGDSKLLAAYSLAIPSNFLSTTVLIIALLGGFISLFYVIRTRLFKKPARGIPYGIAISLGCSLSILAAIGTP